MGSANLEPYAMCFDLRERGRERVKTQVSKDMKMEKQDSQLVVRRKKTVGKNLKGMKKKSKENG